MQPTLRERGQFLSFMWKILSTISWEDNVFKLDVCEELWGLIWGGTIWRFLWVEEGVTRDKKNTRR